jgi:hypothetical protein
MTRRCQEVSVAVNRCAINAGGIGLSVQKVVTLVLSIPQQ